MTYESTAFVTVPGSYSPSFASPSFNWMLQIIGVSQPRKKSILASHEFNELSEQYFYLTVHLNITIAVNLKNRTIHNHNSIYRGRGEGSEYRSIVQVAPFVRIEYDKGKLYYLCLHRCCAIILLLYFCSSYQYITTRRLLS